MITFKGLLLKVQYIFMITLLKMVEKVIDEIIIVVDKGVDFKQFEGLATSINLELQLGSKRMMQNLNQKFPRKTDNLELSPVKQ